MPSIKNLFGFRKNKGLDKSIIQTNPYKNNTDLNKRQFIKKGLLGMAGLGGLALASKVAKAGGLVFNDGSTQSAGSLDGTSILSTGETGGTKFLREDGDGTSSWQAAGGGKVLQVVTNIVATQASSSSSTYADTGITGTITLSNSSNHVLIITTVPSCAKNAYTTLQLRLMDDTTILAFRTNISDTDSAAWLGSADCVFVYKDTPGDTNAHTYRVTFRSSADIDGVNVMMNNSASCTTLMEIEA